MIQIQAPYSHKVKLFGHGHRFRFLHQRNGQVLGQALGQALLVVAEESMPTGGQVRFLHEFGQVLDGDGAERQEVRPTGQVVVSHPRSGCAPDSAWKSPQAFPAMAL